MDLEQVATNFGLPGLLILVIFLLQKARDERQAKLEERKLEIEEKRIDGMFRQAEAMATGFTSLVQAMANNHAQDIESHTELATAIAGIKGALEERRPTPVEGVAVQRPSTSPGQPAGYYSPRKPPREDG